MKKKTKDRKQGTLKRYATKGKRGKKKEKEEHEGKS